VQFGALGKPRSCFHVHPRPYWSAKHLAKFQSRRGEDLEPPTKQDERESAFNRTARGRKHFKQRQSYSISGCEGVFALWSGEILHPIKIRLSSASVVGIVSLFSGGVAKW
jgi:hypothetical protein